MTVVRAICTDMGETLQHASSMLWCKNGIAKLRANIRGQRETTTILNVQLRSALRCLVATFVAHQRNTKRNPESIYTAFSVSRQQRRGRLICMCRDSGVENNFENAIGSISQSSTRGSYVVVTPSRICRFNLPGHL